MAHIINSNGDIHGDYIWDHAVNILDYLGIYRWVLDPNHVDQWKGKPRSTFDGF